MKQTLFFLLLILGVFIAKSEAHTSVYVGGGWGGGWHHDRVYYGDAWYHPHHVYVYNGDPYAVYYGGYPYYCYDPRYYWNP